MTIRGSVRRSPRRWSGRTAPRTAAMMLGRPRPGARCRSLEPRGLSPLAPCPRRRRRPRPAPPARRGSGGGPRCDRCAWRGPRDASCRDASDGAVAAGASYRVVVQRVESADKWRSRTPAARPSPPSTSPPGGPRWRVSGSRRWPPSSLVLLLARGGPRHRRDAASHLGRPRRRLAAVDGARRRGGRDRRRVGVGRVDRGGERRLVRDRPRRARGRLRDELGRDRHAQGDLDGDAAARAGTATC